MLGFAAVNTEAKDPGATVEKEIACDAVLGFGDNPVTGFDNVTDTNPDPSPEKLSEAIAEITVPAGIPFPETP